jgi:hypothetical protein
MSFHIHGFWHCCFIGTVSPDIGFHFRFFKIKSVLSVVPLIVAKLLYFISPEILKKTS